MIRTGIRSSAIIIKHKQLLLIHRVKNGEEYWVFPGGAVEEGESPEEAVKREVKEETGLEVKNCKILTSDPVEKGYFYRCEVGAGELFFSGPENNSQENSYQPEWVDLKQVSSLPIYPEYGVNYI